VPRDGAGAPWTLLRVGSRLPPSTAASLGWSRSLRFGFVVAVAGATVWFKPLLARGKSLVNGSRRPDLFGRYCFSWAPTRSTGRGLTGGCS